MWKVTSPNGKLTFKICQDNQKSLFYTLEQSGTAIMKDCGMGIQASLGDFSSGFEFASQTESIIRETYSIPAGKKSIYSNHGNELCLSFKIESVQSENLAFVLRIRVFDDGAAFRYELLAEAQEKLTIYSESTEFSFTQQYKDMWLQELVDTYEAPYQQRNWSEVKGRNFGMPCLFFAEEQKCWVMVTEAELLNTNGSYCSCHLRGAGENKFTIGFAPEQIRPMKTSLPFQSPWRVIGVTNNLDELITNTLVYNLNPSSKLEDISWIQPSRNIWSWWSFENGAQLYSEQKKYVDFAAARGFESITVDAGWDDSWVKALCDYAREKGVTVWLWSDMQAVDTLEKATEKIARWATWGVVGLKVDFFMNDSQYTMWQYNMIADIMTQHKLMINFHGSTKPAGEGRTFPNLMTEEGIMGLEHYKWSGMPNAVHNCTVPFTRNVVGPMDYTVTGFSNANRNTTQAHQLALSLVFESGVQHISESIYHLEAWKGTDFLQRQYPRYDGMQLLSGFPGDHAVILRYVKNEWFIGGITAAAKILALPLDFLPEGTFIAELYRDDSEGNMLIKETKTVTSQDTLTLLMLENGGCSVYISDGSHPIKTGMCSGYMREPLALYSADGFALSEGAQLLAYENGDQAVQLNGSITFEHMTEEKKEFQTLRLTYAAQDACTLLLTVNDNELKTTLEASGGKKVFRTFDMVIPINSEKNTICLCRMDGSIPTVREIAIIDNAPNKDTFYLSAEGILGGGVELVPINEASSELKVTGLGLGGSILFDRIEAQIDGEYILSIDYYSGENRPVMISVNNEDAITSVLFNTSGWGPSRWDILGTKEVKVQLKKGINSILFFHKVALAPQISRIAIRLEK